MRPFLMLILTVCVLLTCSLAEAARRGGCAGGQCAGGVCATQPTQEVAAVKAGWPWSPTPKPTPAPLPAPAPPLVVVPPAPYVPADALVAEVPDRPGRQIVSVTIAAIVKAPAKLIAVVVRAPRAIAEAIRGREHRPIAKALRAIGSRLRR